MSKSTKILLIGIVIQLLGLCCVLIGCNNISADDNSNIDNETDTPVSYISSDDLYFASGCDLTLIENYFMENGAEGSDYVYISAEGGNNKISTSYTMRFYPENNNFAIAFSRMVESSDSTTGYVYVETFVGTLQIGYNKNLLNAEYIGVYEFQSVGITSGKGTYYTAKFNFKDIKYKSLTQIADFEDISYTGQVTYAEDFTRANLAFNKKETGEHCYSCLNDCLKVTAEYFEKIDNTYNIADKKVSQETCEHIAVADEGYDSTCTSEGLTDGLHCKLCNKILKEQTIVKAKGHTPVTDKGYAATCTESGLTDGSHCSVCNTIITEQVIIEPSHTYVNRECTVCHKLQPSENLEFQKCYDDNHGDYYGVLGIGSCTDTLIVIPETYDGLAVGSIQGSAFKGNSNIKEVVMLDNIHTIRDKAFYECTQLNDIELSALIEKIGNMAFYGTAYYNDSSNWDNSILYLSNYVVAADTTVSGEINIKSGTILIASNTFDFNDDITSVMVPDSVLYIGDQAFYNCYNLTQVTMSAAIKVIGERAFDSCSKLKTITLSKTIQEIGYDALTSVSNIYYDGTKSEWNNIDLNNNYWGTTTIHCSDGSI